MNLGQKIKALRESKGMTQQELSNLSGVSISSIKKVEADINNNITIGILTKISSALGVESSYFLGEHPISKMMDAVNKPIQTLNKAIDAANEPMRTINKIMKFDKKNKDEQNADADLYFIRKTTSVKASAGGGNELEGVRSYQTGELMPIAKAFFKVPPGKNLGSMEVEGESMTPMLRSGDWVIFREDGAFAGDGLYVVNFSDQLMVKILQLTPRGMLKIVSVNPNFQSYEISLSETQEHFKIVGKVVKSIV